MMVSESLKAFVPPVLSKFKNFQKLKVRPPYRRKAPVPVQPASQMQQGEFQRIEDKLVLSNVQIAQMLPEIHKYMKPSYFHEGTEFSLIESCYFDGPELTFFQHHFMDLPTRYKLRTRRYAPNGIWNDDPALLELKYKEEGVSKKRRFYLTSEMYKALMAGHLMEVSEDFFNLNKKIDKEKLIKRIKKINDLVFQYALRPVLKVQYKRFAFENEDFRLTIDKQIEIEKMGETSIKAETIDPLLQETILNRVQAMSAQYNRSEHCIVELKHRGTIPSWLDNFFKQQQVCTTSFSKYCWGVHEVAIAERFE